MSFLGNHIYVYMKIEFIIPTWERPEKLKVILQSLIVQTNPNWTAHVIIDGITSDYFEVKNIYQKEQRIRFSHLQENHNDWGHTARNYGLQKVEEQWVVMTGDDNYYMPVFVEHFLGIFNAHSTSRFVFCDMVHNLCYGGYKQVISEISLGKIDIGNFMTASKYAKQLTLQTNSYQADWLFVQEFFEKFVTQEDHTFKINKILYVHN